MSESARPREPWTFGCGRPFTREDNVRLDRIYRTDPRSPLHTSQRFPVKRA